MDRSGTVPIPGLVESQRTSIHLLHVDDDPSTLDLTREFLQRKFDTLTFSEATDARTGLEIIDDSEIDCVVSDLDMPGANGLEFLELVRQRNPQLPFILFTGKGSEEIASDAITAGVSDYLQKGRGADQYDLLANRIQNAVAQYRTRRDIEATRNWFNKMLEHSSDFIFVLDGEASMQYVSPAVKRVMGYSPEELVNELAFDYVHPAELDQAMEIFADVLENPGREASLDLRIKHADGSWRWMEVKGRSLTDKPLGSEILVNAREITERKAKEQERDREQDLFTRTQRLASVGGWEYDLREEEIRWTDELRRIFGVSDGFIPDLESAIGFFHPDDQPRLREAIERAIEEGEPYESDYRIVTDDEDVRWVHVKGDPQFEDGDIIRLRGVLQDVHRDREYERHVGALHETTRRLIRAETPRAVAETATEAARDVLGLEINGVCLYDEGENALIVEAHTAEAVAVLDEIPTFRPGESLAWEVFESRSSRVYDDLSVESKTYNRETNIRSELILSLGEYGIFMAGKQAPGGFDDRLVTLANVLAANVEAALDRTYQYQRLQEREQELELQNERLDQFTSTVSHDLRNPIAIATGHLELFRESQDESHLDTVENALTRIADLTEDLLAIARMDYETTKEERLSVAAVAENAWSMIDTRSASLSTEECTLTGDRGQLQALLENVFRNAVGHGGSDVTVRVGPLEDGFFAEDTGKGIPKGDREDVFEHGYSTGYGGSGVGLTIVSRIAHAHGWEVCLTESSEGGARFEFRETTT